MVKSVPIGGLFYADSTFYKRKVVLHNNCYDRISKGCFAIGFSGTNEDAIVAFNEETLVEIEVPAVKFKDIAIGESFIYLGNQYKKLYLDGKSHLAQKDSYLYEFNPEKEVERV